MFRSCVNRLFDVRKAVRSKEPHMFHSFSSTTPSPPHTLQNTRHPSLCPPGLHILRHTTTIIFENLMFQTAVHYYFDITCAWYLSTQPAHARCRLLALTQDAFSQV